jgi:hypothetical protein
MNLFQFLAYAYANLTMSIGVDFMEDGKIIREVRKVWQEYSSDGECSLSPEEIDDHMADIVAKF